MTDLDSVVTFKWKPFDGYRSTFTSEHVNILFRRFRMNYDKPVRCICITDDPVGLDDDIEKVKMWNTFSNLANPTWRHGPNCYPRLPSFGIEFERIAGKRFACLDIDIVFIKNVTSLFEREEDFVIWGTTNPRIPYCASMYMMTAGSHKEVFESFDPACSPQKSNAAGFKGSDQAWINYCFGRDTVIPTWTKADGVYSYGDHIVKQHRGKLPDDARIVIFHGKPDPWEPAAYARSRWITRYYP